MNLGYDVVVILLLLIAIQAFLVDSFQNNISWRRHSAISVLWDVKVDGIEDGGEEEEAVSSSISRVGTMVKVKERLRKMKSQQKEVRDKTLKFAKSIVVKPISAAPMPRAIALVLKDAAEGAVDNVNHSSDKPAVVVAEKEEGDTAFRSARERAETAFEVADEALKQAEMAFEAVRRARSALEEAKAEATAAMSDAEARSVAGAEAMASAAALISSVVEPSALTDISDLSIEDIDFTMTEMAPPFINEDMCLVPGEPLVRVEKAPDNSRRIFAGVDILASVDTLWAVLTNYQDLQKVVPNLKLNEVLEVYPAIDTPFNFTAVGHLTDEEQCKLLAQKMKGSKLKQIGGAKVVGINFSARTTLDVREWPNGLPDFAHFNDELYLGKSRDKRATEQKDIPLIRYRYPRPFAVSSLPTKDISMQSVVDDDGEFRLYQGVWRMQPLPGCAPSGGSATRLTYAVEISPRSYLPVQLIEGRIAKDLCNNLLAIRDVVSNKNVM